MIGNQLGTNLIHVTGSIVLPDVRVKTTWLTPDKIPARNIKKHLCKAGPKMCQDCQLCAFGRAYLSLTASDNRMVLANG